MISFLKKIPLENKLVSSTIITLLILGVVSFLSFVDPFSRVLEYSNLGVRNILFSSGIKGEEVVKNPNLALVAIDNRTLRDKEVGGLGRWQEFDRRYYAQVIENLNAAGAITIGIDVLFSEKADGDEELAAAMKKGDNVILGMSYSSKMRGNLRDEEIIPPTKKLLEAAYDIGFFQPILNERNSLVYSISTHNFTNDKKFYEPFSLATLRKYLDTIYNTDTKSAKHQLGTDPNFIRFHTARGNQASKYEYLPLSLPNKNELLIQYLDKGRDFPILSFVDVYNNEFNPALVKDKIIFIGSSATALHDEFFTPIGILDGVKIHLNLVNTILEKMYITYALPSGELTIIIFLAFGLTLLMMHLQNRTYQLLYSLSFLTLGGFFYIFVYKWFNLIFTHPTEIIIIVILIAVSVTLYKFIYEEKGKRKLKSTLSQYLAEDLVTSVLSNYDEVKLGGTRKEVTLFFSDIAGFTTISENMEPEELVSFLSVYLKEVSDIIIHERGFINKYEGDAVMAIWGAFVQDLRQSYLACKSALMQQEAITRLNIRLKSEFGFEISVRMGLNKGVAVVGNIGSQGKKIEYTALGDTVNTASRFEGINKMYGTLICTGESIAKDEAEHFVFRKIDSIMVKGKNKPVLIFELVCERREGPDMDPIFEKIAKYEKAFDHYQKREFGEAKPLFQELIDSHQDGPSITLLERTNHYLENGCPDDWEGHYRATEK